MIEAHPGLTHEIIGRMTPAQVARIYRVERDKDGRIVPQAASEQPRMSPRDWFFLSWRLKGLPDRHIEKLWASRDNGNSRDE